MNEPFTPANYLRLLSRHWLLIVIPLALALIVAIIFGLITPVQYSATTSLLAPNPQLVWRWDNRVSDVVNLRFDWRAEVIPLIATEEVAQRALDQVQSELSEPMDATTLIDSTDVRLGAGSLFYISVNASQPEDAALLANALAQALPEVVSDLYAGNIDLYTEAQAEALFSYDQIEDELEVFRGDTGMGLGFSGDVAVGGGNDVYGAQSAIKQELMLKNSSRATLQTDLDRLDMVLLAAEVDPTQIKIALLDIPSLRYYDLDLDQIQTLAATDSTVLIATLQAVRADMAENLDILIADVTALQEKHAQYSRTLDNLHRSRGIWAETVNTLERKQIELQMKRIIEGARVQVIDEAQTPQQPSQPNWPLNLGLAFAAGLLGGLLLAVLATYFGAPD
jgi:capsular polysaccharide biosynthesis protein